MNAFRELPNHEKLGLRFAAAGFVVAIGLCAYTLYLTSHHRIGNMLLFIILCPPSIGAMALDNSGLVRGFVGWLFIAGENAALYGLAGLACGLLWDKISHRKSAGGRSQPRK